MSKNELVRRRRCFIQWNANTLKRDDCETIHKRTRTKTLEDAEVGHRTASLGHLAQIAIKAWRIIRRQRKRLERSPQRLLPLPSARHVNGVGILPLASPINHGPLSEPWALMIAALLNRAEAAGPSSQDFALIGTPGSPSAPVLFRRREEIGPSFRAAPVPKARSISRKWTSPRPPCERLTQPAVHCRCANNQASTSGFA